MTGGDITGILLDGERVVIEVKDMARASGGTKAPQAYRPPLRRPYEPHESERRDRRSEMNEEFIKSLYNGWHSLSNENPNVPPVFKVQRSHSLSGSNPKVSIVKDGDMFDYLTEHCSDDDEQKDTAEYFQGILDEPIDPATWKRIVIQAKSERLERIENELTALEDEKELLINDIQWERNQNDKNSQQRGE